MFGQWLALARTRRGLSRKRLARILGWDENTLQRYEEDWRTPSEERMTQLRSVLA